MGTGLVKFRNTTYNIQGVKQSDPSILHDMVEAVEGDSSADVSERDSCDDVSNRRGEGEGGALPSIATSSNKPAVARTLYVTRGSVGAAYGKCPTRYGAEDASHVAGV